MNPNELTIGVEEEYQIIDPETRELTSYVGKILDQGATIFRDQVKPEFMQSQIEIGSNICQNVSEVRQELLHLRRSVHNVASETGCRIVAAGTHPFSRWHDQVVTEGARYKALKDKYELLANRLLIFGMHVHIGIPDHDLRIDIMKQMTYFAPHISALATSSPFWFGRKTGLKSYRSVVFENLPRTGLPEYFDSWKEYSNYIKLLQVTKTIDEPTKIWWDIRPHPKFPTVEFRFCDCTTKVDEVVAIVALTQALVAKLCQLRRRNQTWRIYRRSLIAENKWRSVKDGLDGKLIDFGKKKEVPLRLLIQEIVELVDDVVDELGSRKEIEYIEQMLKNGTSADRQLRKYEETGNMKDVVDMLIDETMESCL